MSKSNFNTRFAPPPSPGVTAKGGLTQQHFKDECDLNNILRRFRATGVPPPDRAPVYADLIDFPVDLQEAYDKISVIEDWFSSLPSNVRESVQNDPVRAWNFIKDNPRLAVEKGFLPSPSRFDDVLPSSKAKPIIEKAVGTAKPEPATNEKPAVGGAGK